MAPEVIKGVSGGHSFEADLWSLGCIIYSLLIGKPPFRGKDIEIIHENITKRKFEYPENIEISDAARDLINLLLKTNPMKRIKLEQIMEHEFMTKNPVPHALPDRYTHVTPSIRFIKQFYPNAELAKK
jgi:serine/threonine protein kinase